MTAAKKFQGFFLNEKFSTLQFQHLFHGFKNIWGQIQRQILLERPLA